MNFTLNDPESDIDLDEENNFCEEDFAEESNYGKDLSVDTADDHYNTDTQKEEEFTTGLSDIIHLGVHYKMSREAINRVLFIMKHTDPAVLANLPSDFRTLLPKFVKPVYKEVPPGEIGIFQLRAVFNEPAFKKRVFAPDIQVGTEIRMKLHIDGIPLYKSSKIEFWPILGEINSTVFTIAVWCGPGKPDDSSIFLQDTIEQLNDLQENGITIDDTSYSFKVVMFLGDAPAKAFALKVTGHGGYHCCTKCWVPGTRSNRNMCYPEIDCKRRSSAEFLLQTDDRYHRGLSELVKLQNFDFVDDIPIDYMHLVCLGIVRKLLLLWLEFSSLLQRRTFSKDIVNAMSKHLLFIAANIVTIRQNSLVNRDHLPIF